MIQLIPQFIVIIYTVVRITVSFQKVIIDPEIKSSRKFGHFMGILLYHFLWNLVLYWGGFYNVFQR